MGLDGGGRGGGRIRSGRDSIPDAGCRRRRRLNPPEKEERLRLFYAAWIPGPTAEAAWDHLGALRSSHPSARWTSWDRYHLTLRFLGEVESVYAPDLSELLDQVDRTGPWWAELKGLGTFPSRGAPSVLWLGMTCPGLRRVHGELESGLVRLGFPREQRPFRPHVTVGRLNRRAQGPAPEPDAAFGRWELQIQRLHLVASDLRPAGPHYTFLHTVVLSGSPVTREGEEP
ncbi:MAG: RNA 2',3'-cyclic phosphodiesterase [Gemmatimonadetes bacterium]|nr:RNA 2',3'-cyclic phosphodiesterase [Gemmatimonadota bacterium]